MSTERLAAKIREIKGKKSKREYTTNPEIHSPTIDSYKLLFTGDILEIPELGYLFYYRVVRDPESPHDPRVYVHTNITAERLAEEPLLQDSIANSFAGKFEEPIFAQPAYFDGEGNLVMQVWHLEDVHPGFYENFKTELEPQLRSWLEKK
jgi:hypothetical protein